MKRHLVLVALASLAASGVLMAQPPATAAPTLRIGIAYDTKDNCFTEGVAAGVERAASEYKVTVFDEFMFDRQGNQSPGAVLDNLSRKSSLVLAVGFFYEDFGEAAAGTNYAIIDTVPDSLGANAQALLFATNEGSFLVGAAAAMTSTSPELGFIGGEDRPDIDVFRAGFVAGAKQMDAAATVEAAYVGWGDPEGAYQSALRMYEAGIEVIYGVAGGSMIGITQAAHDYSAAPGNEKVWMIGCDCDFYDEVDGSLKPFVLTSMIKRVDVAAYETVKAQATGTFGGGVELFDLERDGVDYATSGGYIEDLVPALDGLRQDIIDGGISVP